LEELVSPRSSEHSYAGAFEYEPVMNEPDKSSVYLLNQSLRQMQSAAGVNITTVETIDTSASNTALVSKIRKQAKELSELHEELSTKEKIIEKFRSSRLVSGSNVQRIKGNKSNVEEWRLKYQQERKKYEICLRRLKETKAIVDQKEKEKRRIHQHSENIGIAMKIFQERMQNDVSHTVSHLYYFCNYLPSLCRSQSRTKSRGCIYPFSKKLFN